MRALIVFLLRFVSFALPLALTGGAGWTQGVPANTTLPQGGVVRAGSANIQQGGTALNPVLTVTQQSNRAVINWQSFNLGRDAAVQFQQPSAASVTLNRVLGSDPSSIFGKISSNGQIYLINPNGIYFSPSSSVDVGGLVATTHNMRDDDFMAGSTTFSRDGATGKVVNEGTLRAHMGGYIALLAPEVRNAGIIVAKQGTVALAAGDAVTLNVDANNSLTNLLVKPSTLQALVDNQKIVKAPDGQVILSAQAYNEVAAGVINNSGDISAKGISKSGGMIVLGASTSINQSGKISVSSKAGNGGTVKLDANTVTQSGSIKADSTAQNGKGGLISVTGDVLLLKAGSTLSANGAAGGGTVLVGGDWQGSNGVRQARSVVVEQGASLSANATVAGDGGKIVLWSDVNNPNGFTKFDGTIEATGFAGGKGGQVENSGHYLESNGQITAGEGGKVLFDPYDVTINSSGALPSSNFTASATSAICACNISALLNNGTDVTISTGGIGSPGTDNGMISFGAAGAINKTAGASATLTLSAASAIVISANITSTSNALNLVLDTASATGTSSGILALGTGGITKTGAGTIILTGANTYTGTTTINGGTMRVTSTATVFGATSGGAVIINSGGTLDVQANMGTKAVQLNTGGIITVGAGSGTIGGPVTLAGAGTINTPFALTISGVISGAGVGFTKTGINALTLSGANTFTGGVTVNGGILTANIASVVDGSGNAISGALGAGSNVTLTSGTLTISQPTTIASLAATGGTLTLTSNLTFGGDNSSTTFAAGIGGSGQLIKNGTGTFTNGNTAANTATYVINNGVMKLNAPNSAISSFITIGANGTLDLNGFSAGSGFTPTMHFQGSGFNGQGALINSSATASIVSAYNLYWDSTADFLINTTGNITFSAGYNKSATSPTIVKTGAGYLNATTLSGSLSYLPNSFNIQQGTAKVGSANTTTPLGNISVATGSSVTIYIAGTATYSGVISGGGDVIYSGSGGLTVSGNNTYTGTTTITGSTITLGASTHYTNGVIDYSPLGASPVVSIANAASTTFNIGATTTEILSLSGGGAAGGSLGLATGTLTVGSNNSTTTFAGTVTGTTGSLTKIGSGTFTLSGANSYTGMTNINAGTLIVVNATALGAVNATPANGMVTVASGATLDMQAALTPVKPMTLNGGTLQNSGTVGSYAGTISLTADSTVNVSGSGLTLSGIISNAGGSFGLTKNGSAKLTLSAANTFAGTTTINNGTILMSNAASLGAATATVTINTGGFLDVQATSSNAYVTTLNGGSIGNTSAVLSVYSGALSLVADSQISSTLNGGLTLTGVISGSYGFTKVGAGSGVLTLAAANTYSGVTTISAGGVALGGTTYAAGDFGNTSQIINNSALYYMRTNSATINAPISGTGTLAINNTGGQLTLTGANTFTGAVTLAGGGSKLIITGSLSPSVVINQTNASTSSTVDFSAVTSPVTLASLSSTGSGGYMILGAGGLTVSGGTTNYIGWFQGTAPLTLNGNMTMSSVGAVQNTIPITIGSGGSLTLSGNGYLGGGSGYIYSNLITNNGIFRYSGSSYNQGLSGGMTGTGSVIKDTASTTLSLYGALSYTGTTTVSAGTLMFGNNSQSGVAVATPAGAITVNGTTSSFGIGANADMVFSNSITGTGNFIKWGNYQLTLAGSVNLSGTTTVNSGILKFDNSGSVPAGTFIIPAQNSTLATIELNGLTYSNNINFTSGNNSVTWTNLQNSSATPATLNGNVDILKTLVSNAGIAIGGSGDIVMNGKFTNSSVVNGNGNFVKQGAGKLSITSVSTRTGSTDIINAGTVDLGSTGALVSTFGSAYGLTMTGGTLTFNNQAYVVTNSFSLSGSPSIIGTGTSSLNVATSSALLAGTITTTGTQTYTTAVSTSSSFNGSLTLNTTNANVTFGNLGVVVGQGGNHDFALNLGTGNLTANTVTSSTYVLKSFKMNGSGNVTLTGSNGIYTTNDILIHGLYTGASAVATNGPVTLGDVVSPVSTSAITLTGGAGAVTVNNIGNMTGLNINSSSPNSVVTGTISLATGSFTYNGTVGSTYGTLTFSGTNSANMPVTVSGGTFKLASGQAGLGTGLITVSTGNASFDLNGYSITNSMALNGLGFSTVGTLTNSNASTSAVASGAVVLSVYSVTLGGTGDFTLSGIISGGASSYNLQKIGTGTVTLSGANSFGQTVSVAAGTLALTNPLALTSGITNLTVSAGATLDLQNTVMTTNRPMTLNGKLLASTGTSGYAGSITFGANAVLDAGSGATLTLSNGFGVSSAAFSKGTGVGTVILTGSNTFATGIFTINGGTVQVGSGSTTGTLTGGANNIVNNGNLVFNRSTTAGSPLLLSSMMGTGSITGTGNVTINAPSNALTVDRTITLTGANSQIVLEADSASAAGATLTSDLILSNTLTTSATGTITIFAGSPTATPATGATSVLLTKLAGATSSVQYKTYYASASALSGAVSGTRNFYYRVRPSVTITGGSLVDNKVYDGTLSVAATPTPGSTSGSVDGDTMGSVFQSASYQTAGVGVNKPITANFNVGSTSSSWVVSGYASTVTGGTYTGTITAAPLTLTANDQSITYGQTLALGTNQFTATGLVNGETITSASLYYGLTGTVTTVPTGINAGTYNNIIRPLSPTGAGGFLASNYSITYTNGALTVDRALLTAPSMSVASRAYDGTLVVTPTVGALSGLVGSETLGVTASALIDSANAGTRTATVTYTLANGSNGGLASNYRINSVTQSVAITQRPLSVATTVSDRQYDGTSTIVVTTGAVSNLVGSESLLITASALSDSPNAGARTASVSYSLADGSNGGLASNYSLASLSLPVTIQQRVLTIAGTTVADRAYDGTTVVAATAGTLGNFVGSETVGVTAQGSVPSKDAGIYTATASYTLADGSNGGLAVNYTLPATSHANVTIAPKTLSVTGTTVTDRAYDGTTTIAATLGSVTGLVGTETLNISPLGTAASADAGTHAVQVAYTLGNGTNGGLAGNYVLAATTHSATITPADLVLTGTRPYDQTSSVSGAILTATGLNGDAFLVTGSGHTSNLNSVNAGTYPLATLTGLALGGNLGQGNPNNYQLSTTGSSVIVTKIPITLTGDTSGTVQKTYDGSSALPVTGTVPYQVSGGLLAGDNVNFSGSPAFDSANAGNRAITQGTLVVTGPSAGNYTLSFTNGTGVINKAPLDITANNAAGFYGQTPTLSVSYSGFVNGEDATTANVTSSVVRDPATNILTPSFTASNYIARTVTTGTYTLVAADKMLITLNDASKVYGADYALPAFTALSASYSAADPNNPGSSLIMPVSITNTSASTYSYNDGAGGTGAFRISTNALVSSRVGNYAITVNPSDFSVVGTPHFNAMQVQDGVLTITPRPITVQANGVTKAYDGNTATTAFVVAPTGLISGDVVTASASSGLYSDKNAGNNKNYTLSGVSLAGADAGNYYLSAGSNFTGGNGLITAKSVSVSGITAANKIYDGTTAATVAVNGAVVSGLVAGDTVVVVATGQFENKNAATGKTVTLTSSYNGADAGNYTFTSQSSAVADVTPKALTMTGTVVADKVYDGTVSAIATHGVLTGFVVGEQVVSSITAANFTNKNVGLQTATMSYQLANGTGGLASNYRLDDTTATATITAKTVTIAGLTLPNSKIYDATTSVNLTGTASLLSQAAGTGTSTDGKIYDVDPAVTLSGTALATYNSKDVNTASTMTVSGLSLSGAGSSNYTLLTLSQAGTITPKTLTMSGLTLQSPSKVYDGTTAAVLQNSTGQLQTANVAGTGSSSDGVPYSGDTVTLSGTASANYASKNAGVGISVVYSGVGLSGADASNYTLTQQTPFAAGVITAKNLTVANTIIADKIYDGTHTATVSGGTLVGLIAGDASGVVLTQAGQFADANVATNKSVTLNDTISGAMAGNYALTQPVGLTATITAKTLSVSGMLASDKIYDGNNTATVSGGTLVGLVTADQSQVSLSQTGIFAASSVGTNISVTSTSVLNGPQATNYTLVQPSGLAASITHKDLTVAGSMVTTKIYDTTTAATVSGGSLVGLVSGDTTTTLANPVGTFQDANVGTGIGVTTAYSLSGALSGNYRLVQPSGLSGTITKAILTVTPTVGQSKIYGTTDPALTYTLSGYVGNETVATGLSGGLHRAVGENVSTYTYQVSNFSATNYQFVLAGGAPTFAITPAALTVKANTDAKFVTQSDALNFNSVSYSGFVNGETSAVLGGSLAITRSNVAENNAGTYAGVLQPSGLTATNYSITYQTGDYVIVPAGQLLIRAANATTTYGTTPNYTVLSVNYMQDSNGTYTLKTLTPSGSNPQQYTDGVGGSVSFTLQSSGATGTAGWLNVGTYPIVATSVSKQGNNFLNSPVVVGDLTVTQKSLTPQAAPVKIYDGTTDMPATNVSLSGLITGDVVTSTSSGLYQSRNAGNHLSYSVSNIAISGSDSSNYYLTSTTTTGTNGIVTPKAVTLTAPSKNKIYDTSSLIVASQADLSVLSNQLGIAGDRVSAVTLTYDNQNAGTNKTMSASSALIDDGNGGLNYVVSYQSNYTSSIDRAYLTVTGSSVVTKSYDGTRSATLTGGTLVGVIGSDAVTLAQSGVFAYANAANDISVTATNVISGAAANNYTLIQPSGLTGIITPKILSVSGTVVADKTYSGTTDAVITTMGALQGLVGSETLGLNGVATFASEDAAINKTVTLSYTLSNGNSGGLSSNYVLPPSTTTATINKAALVVTANHDARLIAQGDAFNFNQASYSGFVNGETQAVLGGTLSVTRSNPAQNAAGTYQGVLVASGLTSNNYAITYQSGNYTIMPAEQVLVRVANISQTYGTALNFIPQSVEYLSNGSVLTTLTQTSSSNNSYIYSDGLGGTISFTLVPANPVTSTSGTLTVGNYNITGSSLATTGSNFTGTTVFTGALTIEKALFTPSTNQVTKTYDGSASMGTVGVQLAGIVSQSGVQDVVSTTGTGLYATKNAGTNLGYTVTGLSLIGADAGNYLISGGTTFTGANGVITPKAVTLTAGSSSKIYDGTTSIAATASDLAALTSQLGVAGDKVDAITLTFSNRNTGINKSLTPSAVAISDGQSGQNYQITYAANTFSSITPKAVTLTPQATSKTYDASIFYTANASDLSYLSAQLAVAGDTVTGLTLQTPSKAIGTQTLTASSATVNDGFGGLNYSISYSPSSLTIHPKVISVSNTSVVTKTYDKNTNADLAGGTLTGVEVGDAVTLLQTGQFATMRAGSGIAVTATESISGSDAGNYILTPTTGLVGTITPRSLTVTYSGIDKVYDTSTLAQVRTSDDRISGDNLNINRIAAFTSANVGAGIGVQVTGVALSGSDATNYSVSATGSTIATITPRPVLVTGTSVDTKTYDGTTTASLSGGVVVGLLGTDQVTLHQLGAFASPNASATAIAVTGLDTVSGASAGNYSVEQPIGLSGFITPKALTVTGSQVTDRIYDGTTSIASFAGTLSGFIGSETVTAYSVATASSKNVGTHNATLVYTLANGTNGGLAGNYSLAQTVLPVVITTKDLTVIGTKVETKIFDGKTDAKVSGGTLVGVVGGDQITLVESGVFASSNVGLAVPIIMNDQILGTFVGNYRLLQPQGVTGTINANTPIIYPAPAAASAPVSSPIAVRATPSGNWTVESNILSGTTQSASAASSAIGSSAANPSLAIKVSADTSQIQSVPDVLNVGRVVTIDAVGANPTITSASISFIKGFDPGKTILELNQSGVVQISVDNTTGKINLTGSATVAEYNRIIQSIRMKLNGTSQQRVVSMNVGLVDQTGKRDTRTITLKPNDIQNSVEFKIPSLPVTSNQQTDISSVKRQGAVTIPSLPSAPLLQSGKLVPQRQSAITLPKMSSDTTGNLFSPAGQQVIVLNERIVQPSNSFSQSTNENGVMRYSSFAQ